MRKIMKESVALGAKPLSYLTDNNDENKKRKKWENLNLKITEIV